MRKATLALLLACCFLGGCALFTQVAGDKTTTTLRTAALAAMQTYHDSWQPLLGVYGAEPVCGSAGAPSAPLCQDAKLYRKLYDTDAAIAVCSVAATAALSATNPDMTQVSACLAQIGTQQALIASAAVMK